MEKDWQILRPHPISVETLSRELECHPAMAAVLINRRIDSAENALQFINSSLKQLNPPFSIKDMDAAVERITHAIKHDEKIMIFGDYDVDGVTATVLLLQFLRAAGADVTYYIPHRIAEGYGLKKYHITNVALPKKINLIISVDCGSSSYDAVAAANAAGIDVIVTDHHIVSDPLPAATAVVNPKRPDCNAGFEHLAGVGVAFCLLICLRKKLRRKHFWKTGREPNLKRLCDLVALGTLADMVPLVGENRILVKAGLEAVRSSTHPGLNALLEVSGIDRMRVDENDVVFGLSPRLNAAGRMGHAAVAVELLTTQKTGAAYRVANEIDRMNQTRRAKGEEIFLQIQNHLDRNDHLLQKHAWVFANEGWHLGLLGIVASRMVEKYCRPVVLVTTDGQIGKGSARSMAGINLYHALSACADLLENFGGHATAAGLEIKPESIDHFQVQFEHAVTSTTREEDFKPKLCIDWELGLNDISPALVDQIDTLKPFGCGNREPLFMARNVSVVSAKIVGRYHRQLRLQQTRAKTGKLFHGIQFNVDPGRRLPERFDRMAFRLRWNRWHGKKTAQIIVAET